MISECSYPYTKLIVSSDRLVAVSGPHFHVLDLISGDIIISTTTLEGAALEALLKSGPIHCCQLDKSGRYLATSGEDKMLKVWDTREGRMLSEREIPKKPTALLFTIDSQSIIVADKFGDVFCYPLSPTDVVGGYRPRQRDSLTAHENPSDGLLILGHVSLLSSAILSRDEKHIITADRDEHIRVSKYPNGYDIEMYCLGSKKFVSSLHIPAFEPSLLISGGGDTTLKFWDWMSGELLYDMEVWTTMRPFIRVKPKKRKYREEGDGNEVNDPPNEGRSRKKRRGKATNVRGQLGEEPHATSDGGHIQVTDDPDFDGQALEEAPEPVLVMHKVDSVEVDSSRYLIFSAIGSSALFGRLLTIKNAAQPAHIFSFDLGLPILDFVLHHHCAFVSLDITGMDGTFHVAEPARRFRVLILTAGSKFIEQDPLEGLSATMNTKLTQTASQDALAALELYHMLSSMPKWSDLHPNQTKTRSIPQKHPSKREHARLKTKSALSSTGHDVVRND